jgi:MSHA biogenesis protein MshI
VAAEPNAGARMRVAGAAERFNAWGEQALERVREWTQRIPGLREQTRQELQLGLALVPQGIAIAAVQRPAGGGTPRLTRCEFQPLTRQADPGVALRSLNLQSGELRPGYRLVLNPDEYQMHLVESPDVPDSELREAVRWRIRDLIDFPVDEAAIDVFDMPQQAGTGRETGKMMCVVVARNPVIAQKAALINRSGGELEVIDITDLTLRNLLALTPADRTGVALLYAEATYSLILIVGESTLYLSRRIWIGQQDLLGIAGKDRASEEFRRVADALAMELLRSLEYYESHFSRPAVESLYMAPLTVADEALHAHLSQAIGVQVEALDLNRLLDVPGGGLSPEMQARCLLAVGAALRQERATL